MHPTTVEFLAKDHLQDLQLDPHVRDLQSGRAASSVRVVIAASLGRAAAAMAAAVARMRVPELPQVAKLLGAAARPAAIGSIGSSGGLLMARFMDVHSGFIGVTREQLEAAHEADQAIEGDEGMHFEKAWLDPETGKVFCISTGPTKEALMRIHERAGHPTAEVYEIPIEVV